MNNDEILWEQNANSKKNLAVYFGFFLYEFFSARWTIFAFVGLFNVGAYNLDYLGQGISIGLAIILFYLMLDAFNTFWTGINLNYVIYQDRIAYYWGVTRPNELNIPFDQITQISYTQDPNSKRSALLFNTRSNLKNKDFGFSKEAYFNQLSFENIKDSEKLIKILTEQCGQQVKIIPQDKITQWFDRLPNATLYLKTLQLIAFIWLFISTSILIKIVDCNLLKSMKITELVTDQHRPFSDDESATLTTESGYIINILSKFNYEGEELSFDVSPLYNEVVSVDFKFTTIREIYTGEYNIWRGKNNSFSVLFKLMAVLFMLYSTICIFHSRGNTPFTKLSALVLLPIVFLLLGYGM